MQSGRTCLSDALLATVAALDLQQVNKELADYVPAYRLQELAGRGLRGEILYPVPCVLQAQPRLLGYYRLLLGCSGHLKAKQKGFTEFWTIVNVSSLDETKARVQTPTTNKFYILSRLKDQSSPEYADFRDRIVAYTGIRASP